MVEEKLNRYCWLNPKPLSRGYDVKAYVLTRPSDRDVQLVISKLLTFCLLFDLDYYSGTLTIRSRDSQGLLSILTLLLLNVMIFPCFRPDYWKQYWVYVKANFLIYALKYS